MKNIKVALVLCLLSIIIVSCSDNMTTHGQNDLIEDVIGKYEGNLRDLTNSNKEYSAEVLINKISNTSIEMILLCEIMDTTIIFDVYHNSDSLMICFTDEDFEHHYGHGRSEMNHMMNDGDMWDWMHHLDEDHEPGENHFGGFDMDHHSFNYNFYNLEDERVEYMFEGVKSK